ncbi:MAG: PD40 domain-containing protein [Crocinitomicaceae bacterium]|nr:PD40 domain-containing protein [Crocinitomicaceae bacterium]
MIMRIFFSTLVVLGLIMVSNSAFGRNDYPLTPPDSTSNIIEKGTAQYLIAEGRRIFNEGQYRVALVKFREALVKDKGNALATYWVGECHKALGNYEKAIGYAEEAIAKDPEVDKEYGYLLGVCYHRLAKLDKAIEMYQKCKSMVKETRAKELMLDFLIAQCERAKEMMENPRQVKITNMGMNINSAFDDYSPTISPDGKTFYFTSRRADNKGGGVNPDDQRYFEDIYVSFWDEEKNQWTEAVNSDDLLRRVNTKGFDAVTHISPDGKYMYVTINTMAMDKPKPKTKHSDIFLCRMNNRGGWNSPKNIGKPINSIWFDALASVTADESTMYFISERKGGYGNGDIWSSTKVGKDWGKPVNLGATINTKGQETTVYVTPDEKYLFFSSDRHEGIGGYDVYVCKNQDGQWSDPVNLGYPINTVSDETHFIYLPEQKKGYYTTFSSSENKGVGARDIFEVDMSNYEFNFPDPE